MHLETEIKLPIRSPAQARSRLRSLGVHLERRRHFEDNFLLDDARRRFRQKGSLLRVRRTRSRTTLTYKGRGRVIRRAKVRSEVETRVDDGAALLLILRGMGLEPSFRYQKYRTVYRKGSLLITVDETPIGDYLEIEGPSAGIEQFAKRLGYQPKDFIARSYFELFVAYRKGHRLLSSDMIFGGKGLKGVKRA